MKPSEQWARQGVCAGPLDTAEVADRVRVGVANLLFGSDYVHTEETFPNTWKHLTRVLADVLRDEAWNIVAGNAARLVGFDIDRRAKAPAASRAWRTAAAAA